MQRKLLNRERGVTLLETVVALVLLAVVVLYMSLLPLESQNSLLRSDIQSKANQAGKDKIESFRGLVARWGAGPPPFNGWDTLCIRNAAWRQDTFRTADVNIIRRWIVTKDVPVVNSARIHLICFYPWRGRQDSVVFITHSANRAYIPINP